MSGIRHLTGRIDDRLTGELTLLAIAAVGVLVGLWPVLLTLTSAAPLQLLPLVAHVAGMLAGYGVLVLVMLMARWPRLERGLGSDRLARWHAMTGRAVLTLVLVHAWAATQAWAGARGTGIATALVDVLGMPYLVAATLGTILLVAIAVASARAARRRLSWERWHAIHLAAYVAIALSFLHQLAGPDLAGHLVVQVLWALMYAHTFGLVLRYRVLAPLRAATRHRLRVSQVVREAPGITSIVLAGRDLDELRAEAGQFFRWRFLTPDTWLTAHPFSLSAPPTGDRLRLTIKALGNGSRLLQSIEVGTWVVAEGPYGAMTAARRRRRDVLLIGAGVGITSMRALFESMPLAPGQEMTLLYRARDPSQLAFRAELDALAASRRARVVYLLGSDPDLLSTTSLQRLVPGLVDRDVYLCASPGTSDTVRASLAGAGLQATQVHEERFAL